MELYGPKKRGPKPKTFLLKVRRLVPCAGQGCEPRGSGSLSVPAEDAPREGGLLSCKL